MYLDMERLPFKQTEEGELSIYFHRGTRKNAPLIYLIHGGAWYAGEPVGEMESDDAMFSVLQKAGWACAGVEYRLTGEQKTIRLHDQMEDILDGLCWLSARADALNLDMSRVITTGASAGGHLSLMTALAYPQLRPQPPFRIIGEIDLCGPSDLSSDEGFEGGDWKEQYFQWLEWLIGAPYSEATIPLYRRASPYYYLTPQSPAIFLIHGTADTLVPFRNTQIVYDRARELGVSVVLCPLTGGWHDFRPAIQRMSDPEHPYPVPNGRIFPDGAMALRMAASWAQDLAASL